MKTIVSLEGLEFKAYHGFYDEERKRGNRFICDVSIELKSFDSNDDNIFDTVNYEDVYAIIDEEMKKTCKLIETVAYNIIERLRQAKCLPQIVQEICLLGQSTFEVLVAKCFN